MYGLGIIANDILEPKGVGYACKLVQVQRKVVHLARTVNVEVVVAYIAIVRQVEQTGHLLQVGSYKQGAKKGNELITSDNCTTRRWQSSPSITEQGQHDGLNGRQRRVVRGNQFSNGSPMLVLTTLPMLYKCKWKTWSLNVIVYLSWIQIQVTRLNRGRSRRRRRQSQARALGCQTEKRFSARTDPERECNMGLLFI